MIETVGFRLEALGRALLLDGGLSNEAYLAAFYLTLGISAERPIFVDVTGVRLWLGAETFRSRATGLWKIDKNHRGRYMRAVARTIAQPDEIWTNVERGHGGKAVCRRRYVKVWQEAERILPTLAVFERDRRDNKEWRMVTGYPAERPDDWLDYLNDRVRIGEIIYRGV